MDTPNYSPETIETDAQAYWEKKQSFVVTEDGNNRGAVEPRLNHYTSMNQPIGTPMVLSGLDEDLYLSLINVDDEKGSASLEVLIKPLVWWLWFGGGLMLLGTGVAAWPNRRRAA